MNNAPLTWRQQMWRIPGAMVDAVGIGDHSYRDSSGLIKSSHELLQEIVAIGEPGEDMTELELLYTNIVISKLYKLVKDKGKWLQLLSGDVIDPKSDPEAFDYDLADAVFTLDFMDRTFDLPALLWMIRDRICRHMKEGRWNPEYAEIEKSWKSYVAFVTDYQTPHKRQIKPIEYCLTLSMKPENQGSDQPWFYNENIVKVEQAVECQIGLIHINVLWNLPDDMKTLLRYQLLESTILKAYDAVHILVSKRVQQDEASGRPFLPLYHSVKLGSWKNLNDIGLDLFDSMDFLALPGPSFPPVHHELSEADKDKRWEKMLKQLRPYSNGRFDNCKRLAAG